MRNPHGVEAGRSEAAACVRTRHVAQHSALSGHLGRFCEVEFELGFVSRRQQHSAFYAGWLPGAPEAGRLAAHALPSR
ncbi:hypothetical protein N800_08610 [Lysobacter daejeonensis GH1-9]|uniref:Uncharacterized protein n=1 Tax=Lysobacter daejeonensis GH1-9 TaxID=1385517 RepID=A0A0A0F107_9GAMM|nr:hypothetical protein N800_08610 [Lysobacter daejeonensis GH1-9]